MKKILLILGGMLILFLLAFCCSYTIYQKTDSFSDDSYAVETIPGKSYRFLVNELNGYVAVFTANGSLYEFTDIRIKDLDNILKNRIINGIKFQKEKELFTFLESCSS